MSPQHSLVLYGVIPLWLLAGVADWYFHRRTDIEDTSGVPESALHLLMLAEMGLPLLAAIYFEVNALVLALLGVACIVHEITAYVDVRYAITRREVGVAEQFVHSVLEMSPLMVLLLLASAHWSQWLALWGLGADTARFDLSASSEMPPLAYSVALAVAIALLAALPYVEELLRGWRARQPSRL
ncbi:MAG: hypothetical protein ACTHK2_10760 [Dokdonella sp.]|uniref:hypothetical protein n=1 Tax=Dokdonella sp. TaxID=2291710 RepID=UPI003F7DD1FD